MSQAGIISSLAGPVPPSVATSYVTDSGTAVPSANVLNVITGQSTLNSGSSIFFSGSGNTVELNISDSHSNVIIGNGAGKAGISGSLNTSLGNFTLASLTSGSNNAAFGYNALLELTTGSNNSALGAGSLEFLKTGLNNIAVGQLSGQNYTTNESNNICIGSPGVIGDSAVLRLGNPLVQTTAYIGGVAGVVVANQNVVTINTVTGQLGSSGNFASTITGDSGGALSPTSNNWNIFGRSGSKTSGAASTLTIKSPPYQDQGSSTTITLNSGSFVTAAVTLTLPSSLGLLDGDLFEFVCTTAGALIIQAVGTQKIRIGSLISSAAGTATSTAIGDSVTLRFRASDGFFYATSSMGVWLMA